jgi:hypothetical protein
MWKDTLDFYDKLVALNPKFERKGKTMPYTSANGYMFSLVNKEGELGFRLPKEAQKKFIEEYDSGPFMSHGAKMKDYVLIPEKLFEDMDLLSKYLNESYNFVMSLEAKPKKSK